MVYDKRSSIVLYLKLGLEFDHRTLDIDTSFKFVELNQDICH